MKPIVPARLLISAVPPARMGNVVTDPEVPRPGLPAASVPAAPWSPVSTPAPVTDHDPSAAQAPVAVAPGAVGPRRRWRWAVWTLVALIVVAGLTAGLVVWAPWTPPPVLRPGGPAAC